MKIKQINSLIVVFLSIGFFSGIYAQGTQNCAKQTFCDATLYGDFEYKSQTRSAILSPGDTVRTTVVIYSDQITRILLCGDPQLGKLKFKLFEPIKETHKYVKQINKSSEWVDVEQTDANGKVIKDDWGDPLIVQKEVIKLDTVFGRKLVMSEVEIFDSENNNTGKSYWQQEATKSKRLIIEAIVAKGDASIEGCVNVGVGFKLKKQKQFKME